MDRLDYLHFKLLVRCLDLLGYRTDVWELDKFIKDHRVGLLQSGFSEEDLTFLLQHHHKASRKMLAAVLAEPA